MQQFARKRKKRKQNNMKNLFFGDSLTSGENNGGKSYVDYISNSEKVGVSGTTIGEYSIYPVDGNSLLSLIPRNIEKIKKAENIFLEYGINDSSSIITKYIEGYKVTMSFIKAIDYIKQINPKANIYLLSAHNAILGFAKTQTKYLNDVYMKGYMEHKFDAEEWAGAYAGLHHFVFELSKLKIIEMFNNEEEYLDTLDSDKLHPTDEGYQIIASNIKKELYKEWRIA